MDLQTERDRLQTASVLGELEARFIATAKSYGQRKGISYTAWRALGVPADVLRKAGITRTD